MADKFDEIAERISQPAVLALLNSRCFKEADGLPDAIRNALRQSHADGRAEAASVVAALNYSDQESTNDYDKAHRAGFEYCKVKAARALTPSTDGASHG